jgi:hypothetical protein
LSDSVKRGICEILQHLQQFTGNWPARHFGMKQYTTVVWKWVQVHQIVARKWGFRRHRKAKTTAASWVFALLATHLLLVIGWSH